MFKFLGVFKDDRQDSGVIKNDIVETNKLEENCDNSIYSLPSAKEGEVEIFLTDLRPENGTLLVGFFISNGLKNNIKCHNLNLALIDCNRRILARQSFDEEVIGKIVAGSTKACVARFVSNNIYVQDKISVKDCQLCFVD